MMRIVVDELPKNCHECMFSFFDPDFVAHICQLRNPVVICELIFDSPCPMLIEMKKGSESND